jgi:hypothetical protein
MAFHLLTKRKQQSTDSMDFSKHLKSSPFFSWVCVAQSLVFSVAFCRSLFALFSFFFWPLYCLSFFNLQLLFTPLWYLHTFFHTALSTSEDTVLQGILAANFVHIIQICKDFYLLIYIVNKDVLLEIFYDVSLFNHQARGRHGRDRMVVEFITT